MLSSKLVKGATLKIYKRGSHGICTTQKDEVNADLLASSRADRRAPRRHWRGVPLLIVTKAPKIATFSLADQCMAGCSPAKQPEDCEVAAHDTAAGAYLLDFRNEQQMRHIGLDDEKR
jgi:hypothetical protein